MRWGGLRATIVLSLTGILVAVSLLISVVVLRVNEQLLLQERARGAQGTAAVIAATLEEQLRPVDERGGVHTARLDAAQLQDAVERLSLLPDVVELAVIGPDLRVIAHGSRAAVGQRLLDPEVAPTLLERQRRGEIRPGAEQRRVFLSYIPLGERGQPVAVLRTTFTLRALDQQLAGAQSMVLLYLALDALLLVIVGSWLLDRLIVRPLRRIAETTERISSGTLDPIGIIEGGNEIGRLSVSFNQMVEALTRQRRSLQEKLAQLRQANRELEQARSSMVRAERLASVGTLAAGVAHEVGNPLAAILGYTEVLLQQGEGGGREPLSTGETQELVARIHDQTLRIHAIIRALLDYSRAQPSTIPACGDLGRATQTTLNLLGPQPRLRGIELRSRLPEQLPTLAIDEERLVQVLVNLLLNAADALKGRAGGRIELAVDEGQLGPADRLHLVVQ
ncbi:MAG: HAMP domain-containing protein, partial [Deltaproteobacteria bacterium]|nr:HAMP domain-containing protein [Deltaproteobacteria bacterium]